MKLKEKFWVQMYYKARKENSRELSEQVANQALEDFEKRFEGKETIEWSSPSFTQAGRLKRLFEEMELEINCSNDEEKSSILICGTDVKFHFTNGEFKRIER